ncbi:hypothetical protein [Oceanibaculum indicum]|nr:hypothetical protein [Oceanibaculum indicum]
MTDTPRGCTSPFPFRNHRTMAEVMEREQAAEIRRAEAASPIDQRRRDAAASDRLAEALARSAGQPQTF